VSSKKNKTGKDSGKKKNRPAKPGWVLRAWYALLFTIFSFLIDQSNIFGISDVVKEQNERIYQRLTAGFYGRDPENAQKKLAVMLYTDQAAQLPPRGMGWPMDFIEFGDMMSDIRDVNAQGIFIDIVFRSVEHDPDGFCEFYETISDITGLSYRDHQHFDNCLEITGQLIGAVAEPGPGSNGIQSEWLKREAKLEESKFPVIVGASRDYLDARQDYFNCLDKSAPCLLPGQKVNVFKAFQKAIKAWPVTALLDQVAILAPISIGAENGRSVHLSVGEKEHLSPAWLIAREITKQKPDDYTFLTEDVPEGENLYVKWGGIVSEMQDEAIPLETFNNCVQRGQLLGRMFKLITAQTFPTPSLRGQLIARCPYHLTINMYDYFNVVQKAQLPVQSNEEQTKKFDFQTLKRLLSGRFVMIGLAMQRFSDYTDSPVHGRIAGIYTHAMAVDNLLYYKKNYYKTDPQVTETSFGPYRVLLLIQYVFTFGLALLTLTKINDIKKAVDSGPSNKRWTSCGMVIMSAVFLFLLAGLLSNPGHGALDNALMLFLLFTIVYTWFVYLAKRPLKPLKDILKKPAREAFNNGISSRRNGLCQFMPHVAITFLAFVFLTVIATIFSFCFRFDPFNFLYTFLSGLSLYLLLASNEITEGLATFIMNKDVAGEYFN